MGDYVIKYVSTALGGVGDVMPGSFLAYADPNGRDGRGYQRWTQDPAEAKRYADAAAAHADWSRQSSLKRFRADGKPNRPLTAFTVEIVRL